MFFPCGLWGFYTGGKEADMGEVTGTWEGTAACSPPFSVCPTSLVSPAAEQNPSFSPLAQ